MEAGLSEKSTMFDDTDDESDNEKLESIHPDEVTVAIFCALAHEVVAFRYTLDKELTCSSNVSGRQEYVYSYGRISEHNIVIARPSQMGPVNAAHCAATVSQQFANVRFALMVGVGAGIPSANFDIRLGDVAVSYPGDGHPGVLEYDFGKYKVDGAFELKGALDKPPRILISAISSLEEDEIMNKNPIKKTLNKILENHRFQKPDRNDILFHPTFSHVEAGSDCSACEASAERKVVTRDNRDSPHPVTHRGLILSGGAVVKNPQDRETLCRDKSGTAICFEMEAAGIMDQIPCLVIRGICDYADNHKQNDWQYFAAAAAASYCKVVLRRVPREEVEKIETMREISWGQ
ncbi:wd40 protein [Apiospora saccharicola]|uniref:Wd40 protein n=1 Tax=Apiospora saccharicola TaxID=335842 RepID=A0ABR1V8N1_9PEZI